MRRLPVLTATVITALLLASCGGGGGSSASSSGPDYLALALGNRWTYTTATTGVGFGGPDGDSMETIVSPEPAMSAATLKRQGAVLTGGVYVFSYASVVPGALLQVFTPAFTAFPGTLGSLPMLHLPLKSGDHYFAYNYANQDYGVDDDGDGINETIDLSSEVTVGGIETVTVPAGTFTHALKVTEHRYSRVTRSQDGSQFFVTSDSITWYEPGIGLVKATATFDSSVGTGTSVRELTGYRIADTSTDTMAPAVAQTVPAHNGSINSLTLGNPTQITMTFSEHMDPYTVAPYPATSMPLVIRDAGNAVVSGSVFYNNKELVFTPDAAMPAGTYTATLTGATDALDNALGPYYWIFTVN